MITGKVFYDRGIPQENYELRDDAGPLSMKKYSVLNVNFFQQNK